MSGPNSPDRQRPYPNQTTSSSDFDLPPGVTPLPRDPNQPLHKRPRVFIHRPDEDPQAELDALKNTSYIEAARTVQLSDFTSLHKQPCVRDALLPGIAGGAGVGALRFVMGAKLVRSYNWAVGTCALTSLVMYQVCQRRRRYDKDGIRQAVKILDEKQKLQQKKQEEEAALQSSALPTKAGGFWSSLKFW